ncbi:GDSL esterase/lipase At1g29660-like [Rhodamnia argentea]|uniref:GDSL esterase/lipase At1g29660-like n=1 Tax=Rhodamnia argentea TaxID=178133 RepID=A0A8B8QJW6_9MYRT|nr:GDSL esterase/lipase At1g29660-like [Rhodamnia argentea]
MDSKIAMLFSSFLAISCLRKVVCGDPVVPCYFIFGDSLADNGNNNNLPTLAKADYEPYGIDLPGVGPSGRFTNGLTAFDFIAQSLGFMDPILPHATASGIELLRGVNYASASSGILPGTGSNLGTHISLDDQLQNHQNVIKTIVALVGEAKAKQQLNSCLYTVGMGSNDYINGYFVKGSSASRSNPEQYASLLIDHYYSQLKALHGFGARKIALFGLGSIGCTPFAIASSGSNTCVEKMNAAVKIFNEKLHPLVDHLNNAFTDAKFMLVNITGMSTSSTDAIMELRTACCPMAQTGTCVPNSMPCPDRSAYAFFDGFHPTEVVNQGVAGRAYRATSPTDTYPTDISHLVTY